MGKKQKQRLVIRDDNGNITFDSHAVQKSILNLADSPSISFGSGSISHNLDGQKRLSNC